MSRHWKQAKHILFENPEKSAGIKTEIIRQTNFKNEEWIIDRLYALMGP